MSLKVHPAVAAYKANKAQYDIDNALLWFASNMKGSSFGECEGVLERPEFKALMATVKNPDPFAEIEKVAEDLEYGDLHWLAVFMPTCHARRRITDRELELHQKMSEAEQATARRIYSVHNPEWVGF
jgi:hypothetical protein